MPTKDFEDAYTGLLDLVGQVPVMSGPEATAGGPVEGPSEAVEAVDYWVRESCRGALVLAEAAMKFLRYELASRGVSGDAESVMEDLRSLAVVERVLSPKSPQSLQEAEIIEVALPVGLKQSMPNGRGFSFGELQILYDPSERRPHGLISASHPTRYPTIDELLVARSVPGETNEATNFALISGTHRGHEPRRNDFSFSSNILEKALKPPKLA